MAMSESKSSKLGAALALGALLAVSGCDAVQPRPSCRAQTAEYAARYTMVGTPTGNCTGKLLSAETLHLQAYRAAPNDPKQTPSLAIEPESIAHAIEVAMNPMNPGQEYSIGKFDTAQPNDDNICQVPQMGMDANIAAGGASLKYSWKNLQMYVTPVSNAIHFGAELTRTDGDCVANYKVVAIYPANHCGDGKDPEGHPDPTTGKPDQSACMPVQGSGLSPDFDYTCDTGSLLCLVNGDFPAFKKK
jgi:hypothetical protein